jgi:hypothetical protein
VFGYLPAVPLRLRIDWWDVTMYDSPDAAREAGSGVGIVDQILYVDGRPVALLNHVKQSHEHHIDRDHGTGELVLRPYIGDSEAVLVQRLEAAGLTTEPA